MTASQHPIVEKNRDIAVEPAAASQFTLGPAQAIELSEIARNRDWTLYSLDPDTRQALFLKMPPGLDLAQSAFAYAGQYENAISAAKVDFDDLNEVAQMALPIDNPVLVFSIGRCGSTLVSRIFAETPGVWSLSEPDSMSNLAMGRARFNPSELHDLHTAALRLAFRPPKGRESDRFVVKFRSQTIMAYEPYAKAAPDAVNLFLTRDYPGWLRSFFKMAQTVGHNQEMSDVEFLRYIWSFISCGTSEDFLAQCIDLNAETARFEHFNVAVWARHMMGYQEALATGAQFHNFTYDEINNDRQGTVQRLFDVTGLDHRHMDRAMQAYEEDSQKGSTIARSELTHALPQDRVDDAVRLMRKVFPELHKFAEV